MSTRSQAHCAIASLVGFALIGLGMILAGYLPPPEASLSAPDIAAFYGAHPVLTRFGILLILVGAAGWAALVAAVWTQLRGTGSSAMATLHLIAGSVTYLLITLYAVVLAVAAYRPDRNPEITQALHDLGWFSLFFAGIPFVVQALSAGLAILGDHGPDPVYPRWLGFTGIWVAIALAPGDVLLFFYTGPFAYHGVISFWLALVAFGVWLVALAVCVLRVTRTGQPERTVAAA